MVLDCASFDQNWAALCEGHDGILVSEAFLITSQTFS